MSKDKTNQIIILVGLFLIVLYLLVPKYKFVHLSGWTFLSCNTITGSCRSGIWQDPLKTK